MDFPIYSPMLIGSEQPPFDDPEWIYEIKMDGVRCLAYLYEDHCELINKRQIKLNAKFPELKQIYRQVKKPCVLDGELHVFHDGRSDFFQVQRRTLTSDPFKLHQLQKRSPAVFTAFDILNHNGVDVCDQTLLQRKQLLEKTIKENEKLHISRYIEENGTALFDLTHEQKLEGIVAKRESSRYQNGKRTKDWIKCKHLCEEDYVICGYIPKDHNMLSLVLALYDDARRLHYFGHVTMGVSQSYLFSHIEEQIACPFSELPKGNEDAIWISPFLCGTVKFMEHTATGGLRQPIFKSFREDKQAKDCILNENRT